MRPRRRGRDVKQLVSGRWYPWGMVTDHICCACGAKHEVEIKVDKRGRVWMKWTEKE